MKKESPKPRHFKFTNCLSNQVLFSIIRPTKSSASNAFIEHYEDDPNENPSVKISERFINEE